MGKKIAVIGAGMGGLSAALQLSKAKFDVTVFERRHQAGGKMATETREGVTFDTGPSVFTLSEVLKILAVDLPLIQTDQNFRYIFPKTGKILSVYHDDKRTLDSIAETFGIEAMKEFEAFLTYSKEIWEAAAPHFIYASSPKLSSFFSLKSLRILTKIDPFNTMWNAICQRVKNEDLRWLLARYATYNGSDVRRAPATLNTISFVELSMGAYGIKGGMHTLAQTLENQCRNMGVIFHFNTEILGVSEGFNAVTIQTRDETLSFDAVVSNTDSRFLKGHLLQTKVDSAEPSMSGWVGILKAQKAYDRPPHTVLFPNNDYLSEFKAIFEDHSIIPDPTIYLCAQDKAHEKTSWPEHEILFCMINVSSEEQKSSTEISEIVKKRLLENNLIQKDDDFIYHRGPKEFKTQFPDSYGSIYGSASNSPWSAFLRSGNQLKKNSRIFIASGSAHPGGGVPLCLYSGIQASKELIQFFTK